MIKALLLTGASVAFGACYSQSIDNCTIDKSGQNCTVSKAQCYRNPPTGMMNASVCSTASMTCTGDMCAAQTMAMDPKTCSKCGDTCAAQTSNATCLGGMGTSCSWAPASCTDIYVEPCAATTQSTCTGMAGCVWFTIAETSCGVSTASEGGCTQCTGLMAAFKNAINNQQGKTCKWTAVAPFTQPISFSVGTVAQSADCPAMTPASPADLTALTAFLALTGQVDPTSTVTCQTSGVSALMPSLAFLGLIAAVVA